MNDGALFLLDGDVEPNWVVAILPFIEGGNVLTLYNKTAYYVDWPQNYSFHAANLPFMLCPSDANASTPYNGAEVNVGGGYLGGTNTASVWGRGCYAANSSPRYDGYSQSTWINGAAALGSGNLAWADLTGRGVMLVDNACSMKQITDGTSKTIIVAEIRADIGANADRGVWALPGTPSCLWGHGSNEIDGQWYVDPGPNYSGGTSNGVNTGDMNGTCTNSQTNAGNAQMLVNRGMGCTQDSNNGNILQGPKSMHPGGLLSVFCDGSVHWMDDTIQVGNGAAFGVQTNIGYYEMLFLSSDGGTVPQDVYNN